MVDGVHFAEHTCVVALGIGIDGTKHPLALVEGSTENATPGTAASVREGMGKTLTMLRLGVPRPWPGTRRSPNTIESVNSICREHAGNVKRWQDGQVALRWCAAGIVEAGKQFRRVNGYLRLPALRVALEEFPLICVRTEARGT
jgi:hypothetical protein